MNLIISVAVAISLLVFCIEIEGQQGLSYNFYKNSCPQVEAIVRAGLQPIFLTDPSSPAALLRLLFHDCQVQGCDASILVDRNPNESIESSEMSAGKNFGIRKRESINILKSMVELECPQQVSCADILVLAAREAVATAGGPQINVPLGRRDSAVPPSNELADSLLPPTTIGVDGMLQLFAKKGMTVEESVAIMGAHTLGVTHCLNVLERLKEQEAGHVRGMEPGFEAFLRLKCPQGSTASNASFVWNDPTTLMFDNHYYGNVGRGYGVLRIDAEMVMDPRTAQAVQQFAANQNDFFRAFSSAFVKLSSSGVLTGNQGVIRKSCNSLD